MSMKKVKVSTEQKTKIVLELLKEEETIAQIASQSITKWKKQFLENASLAFEQARAVQEFKDEIKSKDEEIAELQNNWVNQLLKRNGLEKS